MPKKAYFLVLIFLALSFSSLAQLSISGRVVDRDTGEPIPLANISTRPFLGGTVADEEGKFSLELNGENSDTVILLISHVGYDLLETPITQGNYSELVLSLTPSLTKLDEVSVEDSLGGRTGPSNIELRSKEFEYLPSAFNEFTRVLATLPGVVSNNELSSTYSVRGGNFDENLIFVNGIPIYKPLIVKAGQQEGLSFINPDLVGRTNFSSGGWSSEFGDRLSSVLDVNYKQPEEFAGSATLSLLGGSVHVEGAKKDWSWLFGARHKNSEYLLNTLETDGAYLPKFTDIQTYVQYDGFKGGKTSLGLLAGYARNRYQTVPETRESTFGTFARQLRLFVAFDGRDEIEYDTWQGGLVLDHEVSSKFSIRTLLSGVYSIERENLDLEGGYRLCDVDSDPGSSTFNQCAVIVGIGTNYQYGRNKLDLSMMRFEQQFFYNPKSNQEIKIGIGYSYERIEDQLNEYEFIDSLDFVEIDNNSILLTQNQVNSNRLFGFLTHRINSTNGRSDIEYGVRWGYWDFNREFYINPRFRYSFTPAWTQNIRFNAAIGLYYQPPFYRDARMPDGNFSEDILSQKSLHTILGTEYDFQMWGRPFKFISELYYKHLWDVNPYDVENVRIRYFGENNATAYAYGADFRISGEFVKGAESWFSLGLLSTREDIEGDDQGSVRRPTDQRVTFSVFFQDHIPNNPSIRVYLNLIFGSGLPFSPPNNPSSRGSFIGESYNRVDIGFSKIITFQKNLRSLWLGLEVLNLLGVDNTISYTWIQDLSNRQIAVPNSLSQRYFNLKAQIKF